MNAVGFDASPLGNHEFDAGTSTLGVLIAADARGAAGPAADRYVGTLFPYLSANLGFSNDYSLNSLFSAAPVDATSNGGANTIAPMAAFTVDGHEKVAVIGATTTILATISSSGAVVANGGGSDVLIVSVSGFASLSGGSGTDTLIGGVTDLMASGSSDDLLIPLGGRNVMIGASGADLFLLADTHLPPLGTSCDRSALATPLGNARADFGLVKTPKLPRLPSNLYLDA